MERQSFSDKSLEKKDGKKPGVTIFKDFGCTFGSADVFKHGYYNRDSINNSHIGNDVLSGIIVPKDMTAILYVDDNYEGQSLTINGPAEICDIRKEHFPDNAVSSMKVFHHTEATILTKGEWFVADSKVSKGGLSVSLTKGYTISHENILDTTEQQEITTSVEEGLIFEDASVDTTIGFEESQSVSNIIEKSTEETCSTSCENPNGGPVTLYQWKTTTSQVRGTEVITCYYVCRHGENTLHMSTCPAGACKNNECTKCFELYKRGENDNGYLEEVVPAINEKESKGKQFLQ